MSSVEIPYLQPVNAGTIDSILANNSLDLSLKKRVKEKVRKVAFDLSRFAIVPHFAADLTVGLYEYAHFVSDKNVTADGVRRLDIAGDGSPIIVIGGFGTGDFFYTDYRNNLREANYEAYPSGISGINWGNFGTHVDEAKEQLKRVADKHQSPAILVGHSLGGSIAKVLAYEEPDLVHSIDAFAAPLNPYPDRAIRSSLIHVLAKGFLRIDRDARKRLKKAFEADLGIPYRSYIPRIGMVLDLETCRQDSTATLIERRGESHVGAIVNIKNYIDMLTYLKEDRESRAAS